MLSRLPGNIPFSSIPQPSSDASGAFGSGAASACAAAGSQAAPVALPAGGDGAIRDETRDETSEETTAQAAGSVHHDAEAAVAHRFWLPNDAWSSITEFLPRPDVLSLRTASHEIKLQVDDAIQSLKIRPEHFPRFLDSDSFKNVRHLNASLLDRTTLNQLIAHLALHPRPEMAIKLGPLRTITHANTLLAFSTLSLRELVLDLTLAGPDDLNALAGCRFPIDLSVRFMTPGQLLSASNLPMLRRLTTTSCVWTTADIATRFAAHRGLEALSITVLPATSSQTLQALASIPTLREFHVNALYGNDLDVPTARTIAANPSIQDVMVWSYGPGIDEDGLVALSESASLTTLHVPMRAAMLGLAAMKSLKHLALDAKRSLPTSILDAATAQSIAALPALASIVFPEMGREPGALTPIFKNSTATTLLFRRPTSDKPNYFDAEERAALRENTRLRAVTFATDDVDGTDREAVLNHPTIDFVKIGVTEFTRPPESNATLTRRLG